MRAICVAFFCVCLLYAVCRCLSVCGHWTLQSIEANAYYLDRVADHFCEKLGCIGNFVANTLYDAESEWSVAATQRLVRIRIIVIVVVVDWEQSIDESRWSSLCGTGRKRQIEKRGYCLN